MESLAMTNDSVAVVFPGQGSQSVGMLADVASDFDIVKRTFDEASDVLGYDLWHLSQQGPAEVLDQTIHTQPALLAGGYAVWRVLQSQEAFTPVMMAGHSLGEYTALVCANALPFQDAIKLVAARGEYMQDAVQPGVGAMAALIGLDEETVSAICKQAIASSNEVLTPANFNSVGQIVVAGHKTAVERAIVLAKEQGAKLAVMIPVSVPSHCELMRPAAKRLEALLATIKIQKPSIPVLSNADVICYDTPDSIRAGLVKQLYLPVRWVEIIQHMVALKVNRVIECGPGKILTGLNKRIDKQMQYVTTTDLLVRSA
jgi:[acyl-carrier-protein] S-malonyltransferase